MARRKTRVNTPLLLTGGCIVLVLGGAGAYAYKHRHKINPLVYIQQGDLAMNQLDYDSAARDYGMAATLIPTDSEVHAKLGRAYWKGLKAGGDGLTNAIKEYKSAEEIDPNSKEAWSGLLETSEALVEYFESHPNQLVDPQRLPESINTAREAAEHLARLEPDNLDAQAAKPIFIIRTWILGLTLPESAADQEIPLDKRPTPEQRVEQAISDLSKMAREHPENDKLPYWVARAKVYQGQQALKNSDHPENAPGLFAEALAEFDPSIAAKPDLVDLYLRKVEIIRQLITSDPSPTTAADYHNKLHDTLEEAQKHLDPKNERQYLAARQQWAYVLSVTDPYAAQQVYKDLITKFPDEIVVRLQLARLLQRDASRRADALAVLDAIPSLPAASVTSPIQRANWEVWVLNGKLLRADIETDQLGATPPGKQRQKLAADIQDSLSSARKLFADTPQLLRVEGRFQLYNGQIVDAINTLSQAVDKATATGTLDPDLLRTAANAYRAGTQTGKAIEMLEKAMAADPTYANNSDIRTSLATMNLDNKDIAKARPHIDWLAVRFPDRPQVIELEIRALGPDADPRVARALYDKLPEKEPADTAAKAQAAAALGFKDESIRLLSIMNHRSPGDIQLVFSLVPYLKEANRVDDGNKVIDTCLAIHPGDQSLKVLKLALNGDDKSDIVDKELQAILNIPDPFIRNVKLSQFYEAQQQTDKQLAALLSAAAAQPDEPNVQNQIFQLYLGQGRYDQAAAMLPHLAAINADNAHGKMLECKLDLAKQDVQGALAASRQMTHDEPGMAGSYEMYGEALELAGQLDVACQQFQTALNMQATNLDASRNLIECSVKQGKLADAQAYIKAARTRFPDDPDYLNMSVQYEINWGNPESILGDLNTAIHAKPKDKRIYGMTADALLASMRARAAKGDADGAAGYLSKALELLRTAVVNWPDDLRFVNGLAQLQLENKDLASAETTLKTISDRPRWKGQPAPLVLLAKVYLQARKLDLAEACLQQALEADPKLVDAHMTLADCKILEQKPDDALIALQPVLGSFPVRQKYTQLLLQMNKGAMAETQLDDAIKAEPGNVDLINLRLYVYDAEGRYDQGLRAANDALAADHSNVVAYYWRGRFEASGATPNFDKALTDLGFFRDSMPTDIRGRALIAEILDIKGDRDGAIHELEAALSSAPQERGIRLALLRDYLSALPPRMADAQQLLSQTLALPAFAHDPEFESKAALVWAQTGQPDKAVAAMRDVLAHVKDKGPYMADYFEVLLRTKTAANYALLLQESDQYTGDPRTNWFIFNDRAIAKAATGDYTGAAAEFKIALDRCAIEKSEDAASVIVASIEKYMNIEKGKTGVQSALEMVLPRAQNSVAWKLLAVQLYMDETNIPDGLKLLESAMPSIDSLAVADRLHMLRLAAALYFRCTPPQVDKCIDTYKQILAIDPNDVNAMNDLACVMSDLQNNPKGALAWSQKAFDLVQKSGKVVDRIYDTQGWILIQLDRYQQGIDILDKAVDSSDFPEAHFHLAAGYLKMQLPEDAQRELTKANDVLNNEVAHNAPFDPTLKGKIDAAVKQADKMIKDKTQVKADQ
jgi:tetratricopeptide (TPR) repeat protein